MQISIQEALLIRFKEFQENPEKSLKEKSTNYQKDWAKAVQCFQIRINKDRIKENQPPLSFIAVRQKLVALKEIDDLRWFYRQCVKYSYTRHKISRNKNSFSKCFFGSLKLDNI